MNARTTIAFLTGATIAWAARTYWRMLLGWALSRGD